MLFPDNIGTRIAIDESSLSNGELYTFVTNRDARTREKSLIAVVAGTKSEDVIDALRRIDEEKRLTVEEITLDSVSYTHLDVVLYAANAPEHVQIAEVLVLATHQANGYTFSKDTSRVEHLS